RFEIENGVDRGQYFAFVTLQAPSLLSPKGRSAIGEPLDTRYFEKNTAHELSTIFIERVTLNRGSGWRLYSAPSWFVQGFEEYLALNCSTEHARRVTLPTYVAAVRASRSRAASGITGTDPGKDPYIQGAVRLLFFHRVFGKDRVHAILTNGAPTFD